MTNYERSRGGCATCKQKHIKCDETRPHCKKCTSKRLTCPGYTPRLVWKTTVADISQRHAVKKRKISSAGVSPPTFFNTRSVSPSGPGCEAPTEAQQSAQDEQSSEQTRDAAHETPDINQQPLHEEQLGEWARDVASFDDHVSCMFGSSQLRHPVSVEKIGETAEDDMTAPLMPQSCGEETGSQDPDPDPLSCIDSAHSLDLTSLSLPQNGEILLEQPHTEASVSPTFTITSDSFFGTSGSMVASSWEEFDGFIDSHDKHRINTLTHEDDANAQDTSALELDKYLGAADDIARLTAGWALSTGTLSPNFLDSNTKQGLTVHYFETICQILSCFDSHENPFRSDVPRVMLTCDYIRDCVIGMSAAHLANTSARMESIALSLQARAMAGLSRVLKTIQTPCRGGRGQLTHQDPLSQAARYQALLAAMLLGISSAWYDASAASLTHLIGARSLFQAWLLDEGFVSCIERPPLLDRHQSFLVGAMVYLECLAAFIFDQPLDSLEYLRRFSTLAEGQRIYPNPWTGVSTSIFVHLAETAILMRCKRTSASCHLAMPQRRCSMCWCDTITRTAKNIYERVLGHFPPSADMIDNIKDANTPVDHLVSIDIIYRLVVLMELVQAFPRLSVGGDCETNDIAEITTQTEKMSFDCAIAILSVVSQLPESSGANIMLSIPLIAAGSALQTRQCLENWRSPAIPRGLRDSISAVMHGPEMLANWRTQTQFRLEQTHRRVGVAPLRYASQLLQEVWRRADMAPSQGENGAERRPSVHWMDIMIDEKLETLFG